jgi:hypothetical protein
MSSATSSAQSMRQQLDDLDTLLQRMLSLPINQLEDTPSPPVPPRPDGAVRAAPARVDAPMTATTAPPPLAPAPSPPRMRLLADSGPVPPPPDTEPIGYERAFTINLNPQNGSSVLGPRSPARWLDADPMPLPTPPRPAPRPVTPPSKPGPETMPQPVAKAIVSIEPLPSAAPSPATTPQVPVSESLRPSPVHRPRTPLVLLPFALVENIFDAIAGVFGSPGEWLASSAGKNLLGYVGLLMLGGCAAWGVLDWFGWTR